MIELPQRSQFNRAFFCRLKQFRGIATRYYKRGKYLLEAVKSFYIYILARKRTWGHKIGVIPEFTKKYHIKSLVYYEQHSYTEVSY